MPFIFNPYQNEYTSLNELKEFVGRLVTQAVFWHATNKPNGILSKTKVTVEGSLWNLQDNQPAFNTQINVVLDCFNPINQNIYKLSVDNRQKTCNVVAQIQIRRTGDEKAVRDLEEIFEFLHQSFCFNSNSETEPLLFSEQLTITQGFSNKTYSSQLYGSNRLENVTLNKEDSFFKISLDFLFSINKQ